MKNVVLYSSNRMDWETPRDFFNKLNAEFHFTLDPCCSQETAKCLKYFTPEIDGLAQSWTDETVFMNPPYGRKIAKWVSKAYMEAKYHNAFVVCLLPARTDTRWWWDYCMKGDIRFIKGRLKFKGKNSIGVVVNNSATFPSAVVIFSRSLR